MIRHQYCGDLTTHFARLCGEKSCVVETTGDCHVIQVNIEVWVVTTSISDHGHQISYSRTIADFDTERSSFARARSRCVDVTIPLPVLMYASEQLLTI
jgi:hypothetical protein